MTSWTGTRAWRISFWSAGRGSSSIRFWRRLRTLFSCPAVVWIAYQRYSIALPREPRDSVHEDHLEHVVHQADRDAEHDAEHDDHPRRLDQLVAGRPGDLLHLLAHADQELPGAAHPPGQPVGPRRHLYPVHGYFDSLCTRCASHRGQYFRRSTRSGCLRLFLSAKKLRLLHSVHSNVILSLGTLQPSRRRRRRRRRGRRGRRGRVSRDHSVLSVVSVVSVTSESW